MHDEIHVLSHEAMAAREVLANLRHEVALMVGHPAALAAHEVELVVGMRDLPVAAGIAEAHLVGQVQLGEQRECPVDAGDVEVGHLARHLGMDLLRRQVMLGAAQHLPHQLTLRRQPVALAAQSMAHIHTASMPHQRGYPHPMIRVELRTDLSQGVLDEILGLIEAATRIDGHRPVGEHKYSHLVVGAHAWVGVLAYDGDQLVGYAHTRWNSVGATPRMAVEVVVHPEYYGTDVARQILWETRSVLARAGGGVLFLWVHRVEDARTTLAAQLGFEIQRQLAFMRRPLIDAPAEPSFPADVAVRPYRPDSDDDEFLRVNNAAFQGHPENGGWDRDTFAQRRSLDWFDPDGLLMAWQADRCVGFHWTKWHAHDSDEVPAHEPVGEVYVLAVDPQAHRGGLGRALLRAGLRHLHGRGCRQAILYVDCASTGAVALYESEEFSIEYREVCYQDVVVPVVAHVDTGLLRPT